MVWQTLSYEYCNTAVRIYYLRRPINCGTVKHPPPGTCQALIKPRLKRPIESLQEQEVLTSAQCV